MDMVTTTHGTTATCIKVILMNLFKTFKANKIATGQTYHPGVASQHLLLPQEYSVAVNLISQVLKL